jgi:hypothetical protein
VKYEKLYQLVLRDSPVFLNIRTKAAIGFSPSGEYVGTKDYAIVLRGLINIEATDEEAFDTAIARVLKSEVDQVLFTVNNGYIFIQKCIVQAPAWITGYWVAENNGTGRELPVYSLKTRKEVILA